MTGYTILAGSLIFFIIFIYATWFGTQLKLEKQQDKGPTIIINPYDNMSLGRRFIDKKNKQIGIFDLGKSYSYYWDGINISVYFNKCRIGLFYLIVVYPK